MRVRIHGDRLILDRALIALLGTKMSLACFPDARTLSIWSTDEIDNAFERALETVDNDRRNILRRHFAAQTADVAVGDDGVVEVPKFLLHRAGLDALSEATVVVIDGRADVIRDDSSS
jgi:DNA-binding transcriptional regulator/RsmH inhibitor MraZ